MSNLKHGLSKTPEYRIWKDIRQRTLNPKNPRYADYGFRGICMCAEIMDSFEGFLRAVGFRPSPLHSIERIDNDGGYCEGNLTWASSAAQQQNTRRSRRLTYRGRTQSMAAWARELGIPYYRLRSRINRGWSIEEGLTN